MYFSVLIVETAIYVFIMLCMVSIFCLNLSGASMYFNLVRYLCIHSESADDLIGAEIRYVFFFEKGFIVDLVNRDD